MTRDEMILNNIKLVNFVINKLNLRYDRENLFSIGVIGLIKGVDSYDVEKGKISGYLFSCIRNEILMTFRKKKLDTISFETVIKDNLTLEDMITDNYDFTKDVENNDLLNKVYDNLSKLKPRNREILIKYYGLFNTREYKQAELSKIYKTSQANISRIIKKSENKLKGLVKI